MSDVSDRLPPPQKQRREATGPDDCRRRAGVAPKRCSEPDARQGDEERDARRRRRVDGEVRGVAGPRRDARVPVPARGDRRDRPRRQHRVRYPSVDERRTPRRRKQEVEVGDDAPDEPSQRPVEQDRAEGSPDECVGRDGYPEERSVISDRKVDRHASEFGTGHQNAVDGSHSADVAVTVLRVGLPRNDSVWTTARRSSRVRVGTVRVVLSQGNRTVEVRSLRE